jgi:nitrite reductase/ring-hydroxylating ferredoxin subunit
VKTPAGCVAVFRAADDRVFALDDRCPHKGGPLSQGIVHDGRVLCVEQSKWGASVDTARLARKVAPAR